MLRASYPIGEAQGAEAFEDKVTEPVLSAFAHAEERLEILIAGEFDGGTWTASTGHLAGLFERQLWSIPPTGLPTFLRFGRFDRWRDQRLIETIIIFDVPGLMMQARCWPLAPPLGAFLVTPGPATRDGVAETGGDEAEAQTSIDLVEAMISGLMRYDGQTLASMRMVDFWTRDFWWFGPAAIGSFRGHADYERGHQGPFLKAFPDRKGGNRRCRIAERTYTASTGWPSVRATHTGGGWLGLAPTGRPVGMRVMDFWRRDGDRLAENWVFIDIPDLLLQMGLDPFARMRELGPSEHFRW